MALLKKLLHFLLNTTEVRSAAAVAVGAVATVLRGHLGVELTAIIDAVAGAILVADQFVLRTAQAAASAIQSAPAAPAAAAPAPAKAAPKATK